MSEQSLSQAAKRASIILLGIDTHASRHTVCRQIGLDTPQPAQSFDTDSLLRWIGKQSSLAERVVCCYEAGPTGFELCRKINGLGTECLVIKPRNWDCYGVRVKTDKLDARSITEALHRYIAGNRDALKPVRIPTLEEQIRRGHSRQRDSLQREAQRLAAMGRSLALYHGFQITGKWWGPRTWATLQKQLPSFLIKLMETYRKCLLLVQSQRDDIEQELHQQAPALLPKGLGAMTHEFISREIGDWSRFGNRRQVASYAGLCPSEYSSGGKRRQGPINKHGNPRLRKLLVETVWRFVQFQPKWIRLEKVARQLSEQGSPGRKRIAVTLARQLVIDLWRLNTNQTTAERLGLVMAEPLQRSRGR